MVCQPWFTVGMEDNKLKELSIYKLSSLSKLTPEQQKQVIENAPLEEMIISHVWLNKYINIPKSINHAIYYHQW